MKTPKEYAEYFMDRSPLLSNEGESIPCNKKLAEHYGDRAAMFIQQLHFRIRGTRKAKTLKDNRYWYFCTLEEWIGDDFPFWSQSTLQRIIDRLKEDGILIVGNFNTMRRDRTHWYTIEYSRLHEIERRNARERLSPSGQSDQMPTGQNDRMSCGQNAQTITINKKNTDQEKTRPAASPSVTTTASVLATVVKKDTNEKTRVALERKFAQKSPSVPDLQTYWCTLLSMYDYRQNLTFGKQELGNMKVLRKELEGTGVKIQEFLEYCVANWKALRAKITWENKERSRLGETPSFRTIFFCRHDILEVMQGVQGRKKDEKQTVTYTRVEDLPEHIPAARKAQLGDMIRKLGSVTF